MTIQRIPQMNRLYITGDTKPIRQLLSDFNARYDSRGAWLPLRMESEFRAALAAEESYQATISAALATWEAAKSVIPSNYRTRHGAAYGGTVRIDGEAMGEPALDTGRLPWRLIATHETRVRDLTGQSSIDGRVEDADTLYTAGSADGQPLYRITTSRGFGGDVRETYYLPPDLWERLMAAEVVMRGITREAAESWLAEFRGCVGTELYEFALSAGPTPTIGLQISTALPGVETGATGSWDKRPRKEN